MPHIDEHQLITLEQLADEAYVDWMNFLEESYEATGIEPVEGDDISALAQTWAELFELEFEGCGAFRCVFSVPGTDVVMKIPWWGSTRDKPYQDNLKEFEIWNTVKSNDFSEHFAEVFAVGGHGEWLLMDKYGWAPSPPSHDEWPDDWVNLFEAAEGMGVKDLHGGNIGRKDGRLAIIDYAGNPKGAIAKIKQRLLK